MAVERHADLVNHLEHLELMTKPGGPHRPVLFMHYQAPPPLGPGPETAVVDAWAPGTTQQTMDTVNGIISGWNWAPHRLLKLLEVRNALNALDGADKTRIWTWLVSGNPMVWAKHEGTNDAAMAAINSAAVMVNRLVELINNVTVTNQMEPHITETRVRLAMMLLEDWPEALTNNPAISPPIAVSGKVQI